MKRIILSSVAASIVIATVMIAADHLDAPAVGSLSSGSTDTDITDFYAFESPADPDNYVFVCNVQGLTAPSVSADLKFNEDVMYEFNLDTDEDLIEDLVVQVIFRDGKAIAFGPVAPSVAGTSGKIENSGSRTEVEVTAYQSDAKVGENNGIKLFAGPRDDPFFMDFFRFVDIVNGAGASLGLEVADPADGSAYATSFSSPGTDAFAGTNVLSIVVEVPKNMIGGTSVQSFSSWAEAKRR